MTPLREPPPRDPLLHTLDRAGILYAEDFDSPAQPPPPEPEPEPEPVEPTFSSGEMEMARQIASEAAVARARADWEASDAHARTLALSAIAAEMTAAQKDGRALAEAAADGTVRVILTMAAGLLPAYCAGHGEAEVRRLLTQLMPSLQREPRITVRVSPAIADRVRADLLGDDDLAARMAVTAAPGLAPGDARVAWANGSLVRDEAAIHAAMVAALAELGLVDPAAPATPRNDRRRHSEERSDDPVMSREGQQPPLPRAARGDGLTERTPAHAADYSRSHADVQ
jgi:flagellar assembly protein FliH